MDNWGIFYWTQYTESSSSSSTKKRRISNENESFNKKSKLYVPSRKRKRE